jgi:hypothetical protein
VPPRPTSAPPGPAPAAGSPWAAPRPAPADARLADSAASTAGSAAVAGFDGPAGPDARVARMPSVGGVQLLSSALSTTVTGPDPVASPSSLSVFGF